MQQHALLFQKILIDIIYQEADLVFRGEIHAHDIPVVLCNFKHLGVSPHIRVTGIFFHQDFGLDQVIYYMLYRHKADIILFRKDASRSLPFSKNRLENIFHIDISDILYRQNLFLFSRHSVMNLPLNLLDYCIQAKRDLSIISTASSTFSLDVIKAGCMTTTTFSRFFRLSSSVIRPFLSIVS